MSYFLEKFTLLNGSWSVHLLIPKKSEFTDALSYLTGGLQRSKNLCLPLCSLKGQHNHTLYRIVTRRHQIDDMGKLFVSLEWNIRQQVSSSQNEGTALSGIRYATQYDFDKFCFENPDNRYPIDWNAEVYKAFISSAPGIYSPTENGDLP